MPIKVLALGGVFEFFLRGGGGSASFIFMGAGIFQILTRSCSAFPISTRNAGFASKALFIS